MTDHLQDLFNKQAELQNKLGTMPFKDQKELERVRAIKREDITKHSNPNLHITVYRDEEIETVMLADMFKRILNSDRYDKKVVMINAFDNQAGLMNYAENVSLEDLKVRSKI